MSTLRSVSAATLAALALVACSQPSDAPTGPAVGMPGIDYAVENSTVHGAARAMRNHTWLWTRTNGPAQIHYSTADGRDYVWMDGQVFVHNTQARGHLRANVDHEPRVCFEVDEPGEVFAYGRFECDSTVAYRSVILFGRIRVVEEMDTKQRFCEGLMAKYAKPDWDRPPGFFPRIDQITVYAITIERMSGKETALPEVSQQWPAVDRTKTRVVAVVPSWDPFTT